MGYWYRDTNAKGAVEVEMKKSFTDRLALIDARMATLNNPRFLKEEEGEWGSYNPKTMSKYSIDEEKKKLAEERTAAVLEWKKKI